MLSFYLWDFFLDRYTKSLNYTLSLSGFHSEGSSFLHIQNPRAVTPTARELPGLRTVKGDKKVKNRETQKAGVR